MHDTVWRVFITFKLHLTELSWTGCRHANDGIRSTDGIDEKCTQLPLLREDNAPWRRLNFHSYNLTLRFDLRLYSWNGIFHHIFKPTLLMHLLFLPWAQHSLFIYCTLLILYKFCLMRGGTWNHFCSATVHSDYSVYWSSHCALFWHGSVRRPCGGMGEVICNAWFVKQWFVPSRKGRRREIFWNSWRCCAISVLPHDPYYAIRTSDNLQNPKVKVKVRLSLYLTKHHAMKAIGVRFPAVAGNFSLHYRVQNGSGAHPASYPMGTRGSFPGSKAVGPRSWPLTSI
jgi:hypothetical protein